MALQGTDLLVVQDPTSEAFFKLQISDLDTYLQASDYIQFRGSVDLNLSPANQTPAVTLPAINGDLYIVVSDAATINNGWVMMNGVSSAAENDRLIYLADESKWLLVESSDTGGTVTNVTATAPLDSTEDALTPNISVREARTSTAATDAADSKGTAGVVASLAETTDVVASNNSPSTTAVVTANLLQTTNKGLTDLGTTVSDLDTSLSGDITGLDARITSLETRVTALETGIDGGEYAT